MANDSVINCRQQEEALESSFVCDRTGDALDVLIRHLGKMLHKKSVDKDIAATDFAQKESIRRIVEKLGVVERSIVVASQEYAQGEVLDTG
jgi:hypothetical protein